MAIQFGGLASGIDTGAIVEQLMKLERAPLNRLESDKSWLSNRLTAFTELDGKMKAFADAIKDLNLSSTLKQQTVQQSSSELFTATADSGALNGANYDVEVLKLAQVQKSVSASGVDDKNSASFGTGSLNLIINGGNHNIVIDEDNNSLEGIMRAINKAGLGVSASIINDGTESPYRLVLTGEKVAQSFSLDDSGLNGSTDRLGSYNLNDGNGGLINPPVQVSQKAHIRVDGIDIYSDSNIVADAVPGVKIDLLQAKEGSRTNLNVNQDTAAAKASIEAFVKGYNDVMSFIGKQSVTTGTDGEASGGGVLGGDASINAIKRRLQNMLTEDIPNSGSFSALSQLGFETQKNGTLKINNNTLDKAIKENLNSIVSLFSGENGEKGAITNFKDYLRDMTSPTLGMLQGKKTSIDSNVRRINKQMESMESRLAQKQKNMEKKFSAMEALVSSFNSQSAYLTQQMTMLGNMNKR